MDSVTGTTHNLSALLRRLGARAAAAEADASDARTQVVEAQTQARTALEAIEALEAKARKLEAELAAEKKLSAELLHKVALLTKRLAAATSRPEQQALVTELNQLQAKLDQLSQDKFGTSSERRKAAGKKRTKMSWEKKKTGHGPTPQPNLERTTAVATYLPMSLENIGVSGTGCSASSLIGSINLSDSERSGNETFPVEEHDTIRVGWRGTGGNATPVNTNAMYFAEDTQATCTLSWTYGSDFVPDDSTKKDLGQIYACLISYLDTWTFSACVP